MCVWGVQQKKSKSDLTIKNIGLRVCEYVMYTSLESGLSYIFDTVFTCSAPVELSHPVIRCNLKLQSLTALVAGTKLPVQPALVLDRQFPEKNTLLFGLAVS